jgi:hypothetical protein
VASTCRACTAPVQNGYLCTTCTHSLTDDLDQVGAVLIELDITRSRQDRLGEPGTRRGSGLELPWKERASEAYWVLAATVLVWIREVVERAGHDPVDPVGDNPETWAGWLSRHINRVRLLDVAGECADEIGNALDLATHAVDRPPVTVFVGPCGGMVDSAVCTVDLYAHSGADAVTCQWCGTEHEMEDRRRWLLGRARDRLAPLPTISRALSAWMERQVTPAALRGYVHRGRLIRKGTDRRGQDLYRVGDAADIVVDTWRAQSY